MLRKGDRVFLLESIPILTGTVVEECSMMEVEVLWDNASQYILARNRLALAPTNLTKDIAQQPHYTQWKIQPITFITANALNFCQGNVIKYVMRYKAKNGLEDLKKAKVYIDYLIQELETGEVKP